MAIVRLIMYLLSIGMIVLMTGASLRAEIITDGTVGAQQALSGPNYLIEQSLGRTVGSNLFHSFQRFNLTHTESATFTGSDRLQNVISRVTGGQLSSIDGTLNSQVGQANFYFINPAGVVFGPNAHINVPGDFHVSTASELRFADGAVFDAVHPEISTLTVAIPESFGFLNDHTAAIRIEGSQLTFKPGSLVSLTGDTIEINDGLINSPQGEIHLTAHEDFLMRNSRITATGNHLGMIEINARDATIDSSRIYTHTGGEQTFRQNTGITLNTQSLYLNNTELGSITKGQGDGGAIHLNASDNMQVVGGIIFSVAGQESTGNAGSIALTTEGDLNISKGGSVSSSTFSSGDGGNTFIEAGTLTIDGENSNETGIHNVTLGSGNLGSISINVNHDMTLLNHAQIISKPEKSGTGSGGAIDIQVTNLHMQNLALISTESVNDSAANHININTAESLYLDHSMIATAATQADAGDIDLTASVLIMNGGTLQASALATGARAGDINVNVDAIIASQGQLIVSIGNVQNYPQEVDLNVIQSAAPKGINGKLILSTTELDINGVWLAEPNIEWLDMRSLVESPCLKPGIRDSKLTRKGLGGVPELPSDVRSIPLNRERLGKIMANNSNVSNRRGKAKPVVRSVKSSDPC